MRSRLYLLVCSRDLCSSFGGLYHSFLHYFLLVSLMLLLQVIEVVLESEKECLRKRKVPTCTAWCTESLTSGRELRKVEYQEISINIELHSIKQWVEKYVLNDWTFTFIKVVSYSFFFKLLSLQLYVIDVKCLRSIRNRCGFQECCSSCLECWWRRWCCCCITNEIMLLLTSMTRFRSWLKPCMLC